MVKVSQCKTINPKVDLTVLKKLKKLNTVIIGPDVPLTKKNFDDAGLTHPDELPTRSVTHYSL